MTAQATGLIIAAGSSVRMEGTDKIFAPILGRPIISYSIQAMEECPDIESIILVVSSDNLAKAGLLFESGSCSKIKSIIAGGERRQDSVRIGLSQVQNSHWTVIHDGARPFITSEMISGSLAHASINGSAVAAVPVKDTIKIVDESLFKVNPLDGSFNDLMELKNFLTTYCSTSDDKTTISHFLKAEYYLRQKKIGDAIRELVYINNEFGSSKIAPLANLRISLLYYRLKDYDNALQFASNLEDTEFADKGIILSGQIYEKNIFDREKALEKYMLILDEYPSSIFSEPIRYHIRELNQLES